MAQTRIKDLTEALSADTDDYVVIDGATNGTRKLSADNIGGEKEYDFTTSLTPSIDARGTTMYGYKITPARSADLTTENLIKIKAYLDNNSSGYYPLILTDVIKLSGNCAIYLKSIYFSVQGTSSNTITGILHIVAPFEISSVITYM